MTTQSPHDELEARTPGLEVIRAQMAVMCDEASKLWLTWAIEALKEADKDQPDGASDHARAQAILRAVLPDVKHFYMEAVASYGDVLGKDNPVVVNTCRQIVEAMKRTEYVVQS